MAKQKALSPEMGPPEVEEIDQAAAVYVEKRDNRMALLKQEISAHDTLLALMHDHGLADYELEDGSTVEVVTKEKVRVKRSKGDPEDED